MLVDGLLAAGLVILTILFVPLAPLFSWVPDPSTVITGLPAVLTDGLATASVFLYYLNLGPFLSFAVILFGGILGARVAFMTLDIILPPIPYVGTAYIRITDFIRGA